MSVTSSRKKYQDFYGEALDYIEDKNSWNGDYLLSGLAAVMCSAVNPLFIPAVLLIGATRIVSKIERKSRLEQEVLEMEMGYKPKALVPYLPPDKQKDYLKAVGKETYQAERERAIEAGLGVPPLPEQSTPAALPAAQENAPAPSESAFVFKGDLIHTLADQIHLLISATTGSGKSTILQALARHLIARGDRVSITDPKMEQWGADLQPKVFWPESAQDVVQMIKAMELDFKLRQSPEKPREHSWYVFDEWFLVKALCSTLSPPEITALEQRIIKVIAAGRSLGIHLVIVNQSHYLGDLSLRSNGNSFSTGLRSNIATLGLGAEWTLDGNQQRIAAKYDSIELMLSDKALIPNNDSRELGRKFFSELRRRSDVNRTFMLAAGNVYIHPTPDLATAAAQTVNVTATTSPAKVEVIDWPKMLPLILAQDGGARRAFANVFQNETLVDGGPAWIELRDQLKDELPNLDPLQVAKLRAKFPNVF